MGNRDEFTQATKEKIARAVGYCCSFPECDTQTNSPKEDSISFANIGAACHIVAASDNGPRGDPLMTREQRIHPENGIWMCRNHGELIDANHLKYPRDLLTTWRREAIERCQRRIGKAIRTNDSPGHIADLSNAERFGPDARVILEDGSEILSAKCYPPERSDLDMLGFPRLNFRVLIQKAPQLPSIILYAVQAVVYRFDEVPRYRPMYGVYPCTVFPYLIDIEKPAGIQPRICRSDRYWPIGEPKPIDFTPLMIPDLEPQVIDVRIGAATSGLYTLALDFVIAVGVDRHTFRVLDPTRILFERIA